MHDLVIRNALICDGTGAPPARARSRPCARSWPRPWPPARWASRPRPRRPTTATAAIRCPRGWQSALTASAQALPGVLADAAFRATVKRDLRSPLAVRLFNGEWDKVTVVQTVHPRNRELEGRSIAALAAQRGQAACCATSMPEPVIPDA